jgi:hypothetical protein
LFSDLLENIWRNGELGRTSINDSWIAGILARFLHGLSTIVHTLSFKSPCSKPIWEVLERFKTGSTTNNLGGVVSTEESVWSLTHFLGCNTETDHSVINDSIIFERPKVMKLLLAHLFMRRKSKNTIGFFTETLRFIKCKELEISALIFLKFKFELNETGLWFSKWLDASVILPYESLKFGGTIG